MASKHLFAASELGLFEALGEGPVDLDGLAARTGLTRRTARISADAMVALGLLERHGDRYANSPVAATFLSGATPADLRPLLTFWDRLSYPAWAGPRRSARPRPARPRDLRDRRRTGAGHVGRHRGRHRRRLPRPARGGRAAGGEPGAGHRRRHRLLVDRPGGSRPGPHRDRARTRRGRRASPENELRTTAYADRIDVRVGDVLTDDLPRGYDAFLLANLVHYFTPETNRSILHRIRAAAEPGARLLIADFWTDPTHTQPLPAALMAGEFAIHVNDGDVYSVEEGTAWLHDTGWRYLDHRPLAGPMSVIIAETA